MHRDIPVSIIQENFDIYNVKVSNSASQTIRRKLERDSYHGNRRVDFVIKLKP